MHINIAVAPRLVISLPAVARGAPGVRRRRGLEVSTTPPAVSDSMLASRLSSRLIVSLVVSSLLSLVVPLVVLVVFSFPLVVSISC